MKLESNRKGILASINLAREIGLIVKRTRVVS